MKQHINRRKLVGNGVKLFTCLCSLVVLASCAKEGEQGGVEPAAVQFSTSITKATGSTWDAGDQIGVFMTATGQPLGDGSLTRNVLFTESSGAFITSPMLYYPAGRAVDFVAYYPYRVTPGTNPYIYKVDVSNQSNPAAIDLMWAKAQNKTSSTTAVALSFNHKLSRIQIRVMPGIGSPNIIGLSVTLTGMPTKADFSIADGTFTNPSAVDDINAKSSGSMFEAFVIPQASVSGRGVVFTLANGDKFTATIPASDEFASGSNYPYLAAIDRTKVTLIREAISDWDGTDNRNDMGTAETLTQYKVGDYYPDPANSSTAIGVVFWLDPNAPFYNASVPATGYFGKIVSLNQQNYVPWGDNNIDEQDDGVQDIRKSSDGSQGTFNLISKRKDQSDFSTTYGAFYWIYQKNANDVNGIWYMPAIDELKTLYNIQGTINPKITSAGGTVVYYYYYLSSTEYASNGAYIIDMANGIVYSNPNAMNKSGYGSDRFVRGIAKF